MKKTLFLIATFLITYAAQSQDLLQLRVIYTEQIYVFINDNNLFRDENGYVIGGKIYNNIECYTATNKKNNTREMVTLKGGTVVAFNDKGEIREGVLARIHENNHSFYPSDNKLVQVLSGTFFRLNSNGELTQTCTTDKDYKFLNDIRQY